MPKNKSVILFFLLILSSTWVSITNSIAALNKFPVGEHSINKIVGPDVFFEIIEPPELEYTYRLKPAKDFGTPFNSSFLGRAIGLVPFEPSNGCHPAKNAEELEGKVALIQRGECSFLTKTIFAEEAGAKAAIIADNYPFSLEDARKTPVWLDYYYVEMISDDKAFTSKSVNIPAGFLLGKNGRMILETLSRLHLSFALINIPVNVTYNHLSELHQPPWLSW